MLNFIYSLILSSLLIPQPSLSKCNDFYQNHPVRSDIMLQVVLKSYGYYDGKIDGQFGNKSTKALILFQGNNNLSPDGVVGYNTCTLFLNKSNIKKYEKLNSTNITNENVKNAEDNFSQEIYSIPYLNSIG